MSTNPFRSLFPLLVTNPKLVYFDNAATSLKPKKVIDELTSFYNDNGMSNKSFQNTLLLDETRKKPLNFLILRLKKLSLPKEQPMRLIC